MYEKDNELKKIITDLIKSNGPIQLSEFMSICVIFAWEFFFYYVVSKFAKSFF